MLLGLAPIEPGWTWVASVVHLTDLHLLVDEDGLELSREQLHSITYRASQRDWHFAKFGELMQGLACQNQDWWNALCRTLPRLVGVLAQAGPGVPTIVAQTGDVEAHGATRSASAQHPGWRALNHCVRMPMGDVHWLDVFGNHDVWPGAFPPFRPWASQASSLQSLVAETGLRGPWPLPPDRIPGPAGVSLDIYRINSVSLDSEAGLLAYGRVSGLRNGRIHMGVRASLGIRRDARSSQTDDTVIRIVLMHHPPHVFDASPGDRMTTCLLFGSKLFGLCAKKARVQLVLAGHRHRLNPRSPTAGHIVEADRQRPLGSETLQLVASTATQEMADIDSAHRASGNSFSVYRLLVDEARSRLRVRRSVLIPQDSPPSFQSRGEHRVLPDLAL